MSEKTLDIQFQKRFLPNLLSNIIYFAVNVVIGLALVPFFLDTLGEAAYGLVPLATSITSYVTLVISSMNTAVSRFLTVDLQRGEIAKANETFNTALFGVLGVVLILLPIALLVAWLAPSFFNTGGEAAFDVFLLFALVLASALIRTFGSTFMAVLFAHNRLDLQNWVNVTNVSLQVAAVVFLFLCFGASLPLVGAAYFIAAALSVLLAFFLSCKTCRTLQIQFTCFAPRRLREILGVTGWISMSTLAYLLRNDAALIVVNILFGAIAGTQYSLIITWTILLISISGLVTNTFTPMSYAYRAKDDKEGLTGFTIFAMKVTGLFLALPVCLACLFSPQLFTLWVGAEYAVLSPLVWITIAPLIVRIQTCCADPIFQSYLRVRVPAIGCMTIGVLNVILSIVIPTIFQNGLYGVACASTFSMILTGAFILTYNAFVLQKPPLTFIKPLMYGVVPIAVMLAAGQVILTLWPISSYVRMIIFAGAVSVVYLIIVCKVILNAEEKVMIRGCMPMFVGRLIPGWLL